MLQTAESALNETHSILQRIRELALQSVNDTLSQSDRDAISIEVTQLISEIDRIAGSTKFNGKSLLNGTLGAKRDESSTLNDTVAGIEDNADIDVTGAAVGTYTISTTASTIKLTDAKGNACVLSSVGDGAQTLDFASMGIKIKLDSSFVAGDEAMDGLDVIVTGTPTIFQLGANLGESMSASIGNMTSSGLGLNNIDLSNHAGALAAIEITDSAISKVSSERAKLGASINRLEYSIDNMQTSIINLTEAESRIRDADMAKEMMEYTKYSILEQVAMALLAQANKRPQLILQLLNQGI